MPRDPERWGGAAALWVTVAGWAGAARRAGAEPIIVTPTKAMTEHDCLEATARDAGRRSSSKFAAVTPQWARQLVRDSQNAWAVRGIDERSHLSNLPTADVPFVWRHHELFHRTGQRLAKDAHAPTIEYLHAPVVWEARRWGLRRPVSGTLLERWGEAPQLRSADLVACVSEEVANEAERLGVKRDRLVVAPMAVDPERFHPDVNVGPLHETFHELGDFVFGWAGSFRKFHAIEKTLEALRLLRDGGCSAGLVLVGDGADRPRMEALADELGVKPWVRFHGQCNNLHMPAALAALDAAVLTAAQGQQFHYSPLKLREYLAVGRPVVAPRLGEMARLLDDGQTALLYEPGDAVGLAAALARLADDHDLRQRIGAAGRRMLLESGTWDVVMRTTLAQLNL